MTLKYISLFSGIEAVSCAWKGLDFECVALSEIDAFPCAVLQHRYPHTQNLGDITQITKEKLDDIKEKHGTIDIVVGGSPCQSFSLAGKRLGLEDARGNLMFEYCRIVETVRPKIFLWENVTGVLSSNGGKDFGCLLEYMAKLGYSLCWRTLDAKFFGVPQRRRRIFLVGCIGKTTRPFEILFEQQGSKRDLGKSKKEKQGYSTEVENRIGEHDEITLLQNNQNHAGIIENATTCYTLTAAMGIGGGHVPMIVDTEYYYYNQTNGTCTGPDPVAGTLLARYETGGGNVPFVLEHSGWRISSWSSNSMKSSNPHSGINEVNKSCTLDTLDPSPTKNQGGICIVENHSYNITFNDTNGGCYIYETIISNALTCSNVTPTHIVESFEYDIETQHSSTLCARDYKGVSSDDFSLNYQKLVLEKLIEPIPCDLYNASLDNTGTFASLTSQSNATGSGPRLIKIVSCDGYNGTIEKSNVAAVREESKVRKLTPIECERLQGFPDNWTQIPYGKKSAQDCPDSPRYKALGNSMAVPVMRWIGLGILETENITTTTTIMGIKK